jgi:hypothetical protein
VLVSPNRKGLGTGSSAGLAKSGTGPRQRDWPDLEEGENGGGWFRCYRWMWEAA